MTTYFDPDCQRCGLSARPRREGLHVCVPGDGPAQCDLLFYGEALGEREEIEGRPFVGSAGHELDLLTARGKLKRSSVRISNVVRCRPLDNRTPNADEVAACMFYTVREIEKVRPKVIVALGVSAIKALTGKGAVGENRGKLLRLLPEYRSSVPVVPTYHPAAYLHNPSNKPAYSRAIVEDMRLARKVVSGEAVPARIVVRDREAADAEVKDALRELYHCDMLACDLEWEVIPEKGKEPRGMWPWSRRRGRLPKVISWALAGRIDGEVLACSIPFGLHYDEVLRRVLTKIPTTYHNAMADLIWLYSMGYEVRLDGDTLLLASLLNLDASLSLEALASTLTTMPGGWKQDEGVGVMPTTVGDWNRMLNHNAGDTVATLLLRERLLRMIAKRDREGVLPLYRHVLLPAVQILARTALDGAPIDEGLLGRMRRNNLRRIHTLTDRVGSQLELPGNSYEQIIGSGAQLGPYLERATGLRLPRTAKKQQTSVTNDWLDQMRGKHKAIPNLILERKASKREAGYWRPWMWLLEAQRDRRLHSVYRLAVARTGRSSAEGELGYTFQQFIRSKNVRRLVRAKEGWLILSVDQSQIELRLIAWLAHERRMLEFLNDGRDLHTAMAGLIKALDAGWTLGRYLKHMDRWISTVTEEERFGAKPANFGVGFGGGPSVLQKTARVNYGIALSDDRAQVAYDAYHQFYPDVKPWQDTFWRDVHRGWGETPLGRIRMVSEDDEGPEGVWRKYINLPVQATASDLSLFCMDYTWELLAAEYGKHLYGIVGNIGFFHDAEQLHLEASERDAIEGIVKQAWEHPPLERIGLDLPVPLVANIKVGKCWKG